MSLMYHYSDGSDIKVSPSEAAPDGWLGGDPRFFHANPTVAKN